MEKLACSAEAWPNTQEQPEPGCLLGNVFFHLHLQEETTLLRILIFIMCAFSVYELGSALHVCL